MHLTRLALTDFRSYAAAELSWPGRDAPSSGLNGQGKTNLVEAAGYVATLGSHRVAADAPLVRHGAERAILRAAVTSAERRQPGRDRDQPGPGQPGQAEPGAGAAAARRCSGMLRTVLFAPEDLALVKGDPGQRRRYPRRAAGRHAPRYAGVRADYERVLRQRTALLKSAGARAQACAGAGARVR